MKYNLLIFSVLLSCHYNSKKIGGSEITIQNDSIPQNKDVNLSNAAVIETSSIDTVIKYSDRDIEYTIEKTIPKEFYSVSNIVRLRLIGDMEEANVDIPYKINHLKRLKHLQIHRSKGLVEFSDDFVFPDSLETIYINFTSLKEIPIGFKNLQKLRELDLCLNSELMLTSEFSKLRYLSRLNLGLSVYNYEIPKYLCELKNLKSLYLRYDSFKGKYPTCLCELKKLEKLALGDPASEDELEYFKKCLPHTEVKR